ncbi:MAG: substrate-binding domain-containing protein [Acetobacteraceae bacterium]|nr:substrate-binding domain-containing protein [Acetobacteraceae bacterium]
MLAAVPALPVLASAASAKADTTDLVLNCDPALVPPMRHAAQRFYASRGVRVRIFPTGPGLLLPQLARAVQNDLICTSRETVRAAIAAGIVAPDAVQGEWRNKLVLAARKGAGAAALKGRIAASDPTPGADMDGPAIVGRMSLGQSAILGVIDTDEVAFLLLGGQAAAGLLHATDVRANPELETLMVVPDEFAPPIVCAVAVTSLARRPDPQAFAAFLVGAAGTAVLREGGLEMPS